MLWDSTHLRIAATGFRALSSITAAGNKQGTGNEIALFGFASRLNLSGCRRSGTHLHVRGNRIQVGSFSFLIMITFLDGFLQVGDTVGRRCTDVKASSKGVVLVTDEEEQTIHRGGDRKL